jgi:hypothetical protein
MTDNLMNQLLKRKEVAQQNEQFLAQQKQLENHFQQNFGLSKAAAGRAAQAAADAHAKAMREADPTHEARQMEAVMDYFRNKNKAAGQAFGVPGAGGVNPQAKTEGQMPQEQMTSQHSGENLGVIPPEALAQAQQQTMQQQDMPQQAAEQQSLPGNLSNNDLELMRQFPALRGLYKQHFKVDPLAETPEQKRVNDYDQKIKLAQAKAELEGKTTNTNAVKTLNQNIVNGVPKVKRQIEEIMKAASPLNIPGYRGNSKAQHNALVSEAADTLIKAKGWPNTNLSLKNAKEILDRGSFETDGAYRERLQNLMSSLNEDYNQSMNVLGEGTNKSASKNKNDFSNMSDEELKKIAGGS